ncbi:MAG: isoamylase early set domain-containing protein [Candidatus Omnitrophota bacterium]|jgi:1,4-alpha-glucan branching enzyme
MKTSTVKSGTTGTTKASPKKKLAKSVDFSHYAPQAKKVGLGGSFNGWNAAKTPMTKGKDGNWKVSLELPSGRYEYRFSVDGDWQNDQHAVECVPNAFGSWNCVVVVK